MKSKKKILRLIDIVFWLFIIVQMIFEIMNGMNSGSINIDLSLDQLQNISSTELILGLFSMFLGFLFLLIFFLIVILLKNFYFTIIYFGYKFAYRKHNKDRLSKIDFKNDHYYRDIIYNHSPATLSYIDNFNLEEKDLVATLILLEKKNQIKINDKIEIINNNIENLSENEKYVLEHIKNNTLQKFDMLIFEEKVIKDCINNNLLEKKEEKKKKLKLKFISHVFIYIGIIILFFSFPDIYNNFLGKNEILGIIFLPVGFILFFVMIIYPFVVSAYIKAYFAMNMINPYVRSKLGEKINHKLEGLKNFIKEFSILDKRTKEEITLWEDYLIYSVMFGINTKITNEILEKITK